MIKSGCFEKNSRFLCRILSSVNLSTLNFQYHFFSFVIMLFLLFPDALCDFRANLILK